MNILSEIQGRLRVALAGLTETPDEFAKLVQPAADAKFGDYQANFAMSLGKRLGKPPRELAQQVVAGLDVADSCEPLEVAGPGFINLTLRSDWIACRLASLLGDDRLGVEPAAKPRTIVIDYSAPNVAKPMHVGHIRSTVIGAALYRTLKFLGHQVISDNHIGDWGTQFGMILYGYKHFRDVAAYQRNPVIELSRLYRMVSQLVGYHEDLAALPELKKQLDRQEKVVADLIAAPAPTDKAQAKAADKSLKKAEDNLDELRKSLSAMHERIARVETNPPLELAARQHPDIGAAVLAETAKLHSGESENMQIWHEVLPACRDEIDRIYHRLQVSFDHTLGESFYHELLVPIVKTLTSIGLAHKSDGATCVFIEGHESPFMIRKQDGAFLYATTDLATLIYRVVVLQPDVVLYVVDHRQSLHFQHLFATARMWAADESKFWKCLLAEVLSPPWGTAHIPFGSRDQLIRNIPLSSNVRRLSDVELQHVSFGTVLGEDGRPYKTRSGDTVGLEGLLDEAVSRALAIVSANDDRKPNGRELTDEQRADVADSVGIGALKYADLSQNRTSDYVFSYEKMLAMNGNTATYMQYAYARVLSIFSRGGFEPALVRRNAEPILLTHSAERALGVAILQFSEALDLVATDYFPNHLTSYLFELANRYSTFFENCPVLKAESEELRISRLKLCDLTARTIRLGLELLGINVVEKM